MRQTRGLRETKRLAAMKHVQIVALRLFDENGFQNVTIEQVATAAEVSESSVYRYFGTKEGLVLADPDFPNEVLTVETTEQSTESAKREPEAIVDKVQQNLVATLSARADDPLVQSRLSYLVEIPDLHAALALDLHRRIREITGELTIDQTSLLDNFDVEVALSATFGATLGALQYWMNTGFKDPLHEILERTIDRINTGIMPGSSATDAPLSENNG